MKIFITGICGFVGSRLALFLVDALPGVEIVGMDNFLRSGSERNRPLLQAKGIRVFHGDIRMQADLESLPQVDWVIDAAANPSVLAGVDGLTSSRQLVAHNLGGSLELLEFCKRQMAGLILLSTSRVYSIPPLAKLPVVSENGAYRLEAGAELPHGVSSLGVTEEFSTAAPVSLYGATKLASEVMALEYGATFGFPVWVDRCGVLAGAGQFGKPDQGIVAFWINAWLRGASLRYIGFDGKGSQVRDAFHPHDLGEMILAQMKIGKPEGRAVWNLGGGSKNGFSLSGLSRWCEERFGKREVLASPEPREFDIPWMVMDFSQANQAFGWTPKISLEEIFEEIARHAEEHPDWLATSLR